MTMNETTKIQLGIYVAYMHVQLTSGSICMLECELLTLVQASQPWRKNSGYTTLQYCMKVYMNLQQII